MNDIMKVTDDNVLTVERLIAKLKMCPMKARVVLASDEEGNGFGGLWHVETYEGDQDPAYDKNPVVLLWPASGTVEGDPDA